MGLECSRGSPAWREPADRPEELLRIRRSRRLVGPRSRAGSEPLCQRIGRAESERLTPSERPRKTGRHRKSYPVDRSAIELVGASVCLPRHIDSGAIEKGCGGILMLSTRRDHSSSYVPRCSRSRRGSLSVHIAAGVAPRRSIKSPRVLTHVCPSPRPAVGRGARKDPLALSSCGRRSAGEGSVYSACGPQTGILGGTKAATVSSLRDCGRVDEEPTTHRC